MATTKIPAAIAVTIISGLIVSACLSPRQNSRQQPETAGSGTVAASVAVAPRVVSEDMKQRAKSLNGFTLDFFVKSGAGVQENFFISPYSVATALALTWPGARGETAAQMGRAFHLKPDANAATELAALQSATNGALTDGNKILVANGLWGQKSYPFSKEYLKTVQALFEAEVRNVNFASKGGRAQAAGEINGWISDKTQGKIKGPVHEDALKEDTRLVLVNTIYFKGVWPEPFESSANSELPFQRLDGTSIDTTFMNKHEDFAYAEDEAAQVVELPYRGDELSMVIVLPKARDGVNALSQDAEWMTRMADKLSSREVVLAIPKFKIETTFGLNAPLGAVGIRDAFAEGIADFSGMTRNGQPELFISEALQKAWVEVDEKGTEAAAATVMVMQPCSALLIPPPPPVIFKADHPFIFLIRDCRTGCILFIGRVMDPTQ